MKVIERERASEREREQERVRREEGEMSKGQGRKKEKIVKGVRERWREVRKESNGE